MLVVGGPPLARVDDRALGNGPNVGDPDDRNAPEPGAHERHIARGALAQQAAQIVGVHRDARRDHRARPHAGLSEFGVYGLLISIAAYVLMVQIQRRGRGRPRDRGARDQDERDRAFSSALRCTRSRACCAG